jgi:hypothetical protein
VFTGSKVPFLYRPQNRLSIIFLVLPFLFAMQFHNPSHVWPFSLWLLNVLNCIFDRIYLIHRFNQFAGCPWLATPRAFLLPFILLMLLEKKTDLSSGNVICDLMSQTLVSMETAALLMQVLDVVKHRCI